MKKLKVLFVGLKYDYNDKSRGLSFEYYYFYRTLVNMKTVDLIFVDTSDFGNKKIRDENNRKILRIVEREKPDVLFCVPFTDQIYKETIDFVTKNTNTVTISWFCDDNWRFDNFTKQWCGYFDYSVTMVEDAVKKYRNIGCKNVIVSQWGCNHFDFKRMKIPYKYDVSFVGQPHGDRREIIDVLRKNGIKVATFGYGWKLTALKMVWNKLAPKLGLKTLFESGRISQREMVRIFNQSKINLNLSKSSKSDTVDQIKGRDFEIPGCGGFLLTGKVGNLENYYVPGKEIVCYDCIDDMIKKIKYYLHNDQEREKIRTAGYIRSLRNHTYEKRFDEIFKNVELKK